jgi:hypothetical protein
MYELGATARPLAAVCTAAIHMVTEFRTTRWRNDYSDLIESAAYAYRYFGYCLTWPIRPLMVTVDSPNRDRCRNVVS